MSPNSSLPGGNAREVFFWPGCGVVRCTAGGALVRFAPLRCAQAFGSQQEMNTMLAPILLQKVIE